MASARGPKPEQAAETAGPRRFLFSNVCLDEGSHELHVDGRAVAIDRKPLDVLLYLLQRPGQLVTKDELAAACWPGRILSDTVLAKTLSRLRVALGDPEQQLIKTQHGQGYKLTAQVRLEASAPQKRPRRENSAPERRQVTVLFCELAASTATDAGEDSGLHQQVLEQRQACAVQMCERYAGTVAEVLGNGLVIYFGYPAAHDDDAERAVRCAYDVLRALRRLPLPVGAGKADFRCSAGVHTGTVVIGGDAGPDAPPEGLAMGLTTTLAVRLQEAAGADMVLISPATLRLISGLFITRELPPLVLPGTAQPVPAFAIVQPSGVRSRLEAAARLTPHVGREEEIQLLMNRWQRAREGQGQVCLLTGEPGFGKSRLLLVLRERIAETAHSWLECRCQALNRDSAYQPLVELMQRALEIQDSDDDSVRLLRLEQAMDAIRFDKAEAVPLLAPLLNIQLPAPYAVALTPEIRRRRTMDLLESWLLALAAQQPLVLVIEDLHWADPSTLDFISRLLEQIARGPALVLLTARPEYLPGWPHRSHLTQLSVPPLRPAEARRMLDSLTGDVALPDALSGDILERAGGVPLFVEEITRSLLESGRLHEGEGAMDRGAVPATLQDSLMARIDRQQDAKPLLQLCAVIGREIPRRLLQQVAGADELTLAEDLRALTDAQLLYQRGSAAQASYVFKHALIQDTAYNSLLAAARQKMHGQVAGAIEQHFPEQAKREPAVVAAHLEKAGDVAGAVRYYRLAAESAGARAAVTETVRYATRALDLLLSTAPGPARDRDELAQQLLLVKWLNYQSGYTHPDLQPRLRRARELAELLGDGVSLLAVTSHLYTSHHFAAKLEPAVRYGRDITELGRRGQQIIVQSTGHSAVAASSYLLGDFELALGESSESIRLCELSSARTWAASVGFDPGVTARLVQVYALWCQGCPDQAVAAAHDCVARATAIDLPHVRCVAEAFALPVAHRYRREPLALATTGAAALAFCEKYSYEDGKARALKSLAVGLCLQGQRQRGLAQLTAVMEVQRRVGALAAFTWDCGTVAEFCIAEGRHLEARKALDEAFDLVERNNERFWEAELHRIEGDWLLATGAGAAKAEARFEQALAVARQLRARSLELRAATSAARLRQAHGDTRGARQLLAPVYEGFTEGFDTPDLQHARALLDSV